MNDQEKREKIAKMPLGELQFRRKMINSAIRVCLNAGDPENAVTRWKRQLGRIQDEIRKRKTGGDKPPDINIRAKPAQLGAAGINPSER